MTTLPALKNIRIEDISKGLSELGFNVILSEKIKETSISHMSLDSRTLDQSSVFFGIAGINHESDYYLQDAVSKKCPIAIIDSPSIDTKVIGDTQVIFLPDLKTHLPQLLRKVCSGVDKLRQLVAVTGTNGKTSVANLYAQASALMGQTAAAIGTIGLVLYQEDGQAEKLSETINTTPDIVTLFTCLHRLAESGVRNISIEASSHGIAQGRLLGLPISTVIFTNLSQDHLDYHGTMSDYAAAKRSIINQFSLKHLILNADDPESKNWILAADTDTQIHLFHALDSTQKNESKGNTSCSFSDPVFLYSGIDFILHHNDRKYQAHIPLIGKFNLANFLAVFAALQAHGFENKRIINCAKRLSGVDGRMEVTQVNNRFVVVDYAHTPDALEQALKAMRDHAKNALWVVFGCGGNRDRTKRAQMGRIAEQFADFVVVTQDNPRNEKPNEIADDILQGLSTQENVLIEHDREKAVKLALEKSCEGDTILLAGKGHETYIEVDGKREFYDERQLVKNLSEAKV